MSKRKQPKGEPQRAEGPDFSSLVERAAPRFKRAVEPLKPKTAAQADYLGSIGRKVCTFGIGPAGTGKSYVAARTAGEMLRERHVHRILLVRPAVESGRGIGFLPGTLEEKMAPYMRSFGPGLVDAMGEGEMEYHLRTGTIGIEPLEFMQGRSWDEPCVVLFDEAQNATFAELKMFLSRVGEGARVVIDGDPAQTMIRDSGLVETVKRIRAVRDVGVVEFTRSDIVRSGFVRDVLDALETDMRDSATVTTDDDSRPDAHLPEFLLQHAHRGQAL